MNKADTWWKTAVFYEIYPKSFYDSNGDGIGDLIGIMKKLPYLKSLGIDALWLAPIFQSPQCDNGYDISDYRKIDPMFGTNQQMNELIYQVHQNGMKIIMDLVVNHTSNQHRWFQESRKSKHNYFSDFYIWRDPNPDGTPPNNWGANFGGSAWTFDELRQQYYLHYFAPQQPDLNWDNPIVRQSVYDLMRFWIAKGIDGWRMDVITFISKDQTFADYPNPKRIQYVVGQQDDGPRLHEFISEINREVLAPFQQMSVGESPGNIDIHRLIDAKRHELNMAFTFEHMLVDARQNGGHGKWDYQSFNIRRFKRILSKWQSKLRTNGWNALYLENHDQARVPSRLGNDKRLRYECATAFATILHGLKGTPFIYQGEEIGMTNMEMPIEDYEDIETTGMYHKMVEEERCSNKKAFQHVANIISRDHARTPMQWNTETNAGFSKGKPWFSVNPRYKEINVQTDLGSKQSVFKYYQRLIQLRHTNSVIQSGDFVELFQTDDKIMGYVRAFQGKRLIVIANLSDQFSTRTVMETGLITNKAKTIIHNYADCNDYHQVLRPFEAMIVQLN